MKINNIRINSFRGIPNELDLDLKGNSLLLLGENGTGKSSIIDAIEFFFTGKISHLMTKGPLALSDHGPSAKNPENASISLDFYSESRSITRTFNSNPSFPDSLRDNIKLAENGQFILRRSQILNLINTTPSLRYKFISGIIGDDKLEEIDTAMYQAKKYLNDDVGKLETNIVNIVEEINDLLYISDSEDVIKALNKLLENEGLKTISSVMELEYSINELNDMNKSSNTELINELNSIFKILKQIPLELTKIYQLLSDAASHRETIIQGHDLSELSLIKILKNSLEIINDETVHCPLCENKVESKKLLKSINNRLESLETLKKSDEELKKSIDNIKEEVITVNDDLKDLLSKIDYFEELNQFKDDVNNNIFALNELKKSFNVNSFIQNGIIEDYNDLRSQIENLLNNMEIESEDLIGAIKPSEEDEQINALYELLSEINEKFKKHNETLDALKTAKNRARISQIIYSEFSNIKKRKIQEVYDSIKENVVRYYNILHPQEGYEDIKLGIDSKKKGSTDLRMTIFGKEDEDPRGFSSEGHLDSLGLCIFLALYEKAYDEFPLLVLDDVVTTMDSRHRENVCQLLFEEFGDKQFIITTHDGIWFDQLKAAQRVYNLGNDFRNCTIVKWDEDYGPDIEPYKVRWEKIKENIENRNINCAGNEGRRYLEWLLKDICNRTMAKIPANYTGKYMVGDLMDPAKSRLLELIKDEKYKECIENSFNELARTVMMANLLSHDNLMAGNVSIDEVGRFCNSVHEIDELLKCDCGAPLGYFRDLKIFRCKNKKCENPVEIKTV